MNDQIQFTEVGGSKLVLHLLRVCFYDYILKRYF